MANNPHNRLVNTWMYGIFGFIYSCALDWDHVFVYIFKVQAPFNISGLPGRPFHDIGIFLLYAVVLSIGITASISRRSFSNPTKLGGDIET